MNEEKVKKAISALIGRPLLKIEEDNFELYYELTRVRLNVLLGGEVFEEFEEAEVDLRFLFAKVFSLIGGEKMAQVESKSVEGYSVKYRSASGQFSDFVEANGALIAKYRNKAFRAGMRSGETIYDRF